MSKQTILIARDVDNFCNTPYGQEINSLIDKYAKEPLRPADFKKAEQAMLGMKQKLGGAAFYKCDDNAKGKLAPSLTNRWLRFTMMYMSVDTTNPNVMVPATTFLQFQKTAVLICIRQYPFALASLHVEKRYGKRTRDFLLYKSEAFQPVVQLALPVTAVFDSYLPREEKTAMPLSFLGKGGLFLGLALRQHLPILQAKMYTYNPPPEKPVVTTMDISNTVHSVTLNMTTFIHEARFSSAQREVYKLYSNLINNPMHTKAMEFGIKLFASGPFRDIYIREPRESWDALCHDIRKMCDTDAWLEVTRRGFEHFQRKGMEVCQLT